MSDREQQDINRAQQAKLLKENAFFNEMMITLKAGYVEKLTKIKKGRGYEEDLKQVHDGLRNLGAIEGFMAKCINDGKIAVDKRSKRELGQ